jgi:hypothetical protein
MEYFVNRLHKNGNVEIYKTRSTYQRWMGAVYIVAGDVLARMLMKEPNVKRGSCSGGCCFSISSFGAAFEYKMIPTGS